MIIGKVHKDYGWYFDKMKHVDANGGVYKMIIIDCRVNVQIDHGDGHYNYTVSNRFVQEEYRKWLDEAVEKELLR